MNVVLHLFEGGSHPKTIKNILAINNIASQLLTGKDLWKYVMPMLLFSTARRGTKQQCDRGMSPRAMTAPVQRLPMLDISALPFVPATLQSPPLPAFGCLQFWMEVFQTSHFGDEKQSISMWELCFNVSWKVWSQHFASLYSVCTPCLGYVSQRPIQPAFQIGHLLIKHNYFIFMGIFQPKKWRQNFH